MNGARQRARRALLVGGVVVAAFAAVFLTTLLVTGGGEAKQPATTAAAARAPATGAAPTALSGEGRLVLTLFEEGDLVVGYLTSVALDGSGLRPITEPPAPDTIASDMRPDVSPDGTTIAFQRAVSGPEHATEPFVHLVGIDGSGLRPLTGGGAPELGPAWSPDGARIAFTRHADGSFDLFVCAADGSRVTQLTRTRTADEDFASWSPDGTRIGFARYDGGFETSSGDIWVMKADGTGARLLLGGENDDSEPAWSPDGSRIAFVRNGRVAVMDADGSHVRELTGRGPAKETQPRWSPDGSLVVFTRDPGEILAVNVDGSELRRLPLDGRASGAVWEPEP